MVGFDGWRWPMARKGKGKPPAYGSAAWHGEQYQNRHRPCAGGCGEAIDVYSAQRKYGGAGLWFCDVCYFMTPEGTNAAIGRGSCRARLCQEGCSAVVSEQ